MNSILSIIVFLIVFFIYIHITYQYKRSEDLEVYELDYINNKNLQEVCDSKQPVIFDYKIFNEDLFNTIQSKIINNDENNDIVIKDIKDYFVGETLASETPPRLKTMESTKETKEFRETPSDNSIEYIMLPYKSAYLLMKSDPKSHYFTENNYEFVEESDYYNLLRKMDDDLKPSFIANTQYDFCSGSKNAYTPLRYHTNYRQFYLVTTGKISVKMTPFKSSKYLRPIKDYENYEFRSPVNVWHMQPKYEKEMDKIKFLEFDILEGSILYIPPYWWVSIKYMNEDTTILGLKYNSVMNIVSNIPDYFMYFIQQQNVKTKVSKVNSLDNTVENHREREQEQEQEQEKSGDENSLEKIHNITI